MFLPFGFCIQLCEVAVCYRVDIINSIKRFPWADLMIMGDWMPPSPTPRSFFSLMMNNDVKSDGVNRSVPNFSGPEEECASRNADRKDQPEANFRDNGTSNSDDLGGPKLRGLMEGIAARAGFNAPRLNTASIIPADLSKKAEVRSPYLTIPPGLSPTTLLDSPVFLSNSLVNSFII